MATRPPFFEAFNPNHPAEWDVYIRRFRCFLSANNITDAAHKRDTFLSLCGQDTFELAQDLLSPTAVEAAEFDTIINRLEKHFNPYATEIISRHAFFKRDQAKGESVISYITALRHAARNCNFSNVEEALRDRLVCGIRDERTRRRLFEKKTLTFQIALKEALAVETAARYAAEVCRTQSLPQRHHPRAVPVHREDVDDSDELEGKVEKLHLASSNRSHTAASSSTPCASGGRPHLWRSCHFRDTECRACKKKGHIAQACRSKESGTASRPLHRDKGGKSAGFSN